MLIVKLKEMEADQLIVRKAEAIILPKVTYHLAEARLALGPILKALAGWGRSYMKEGVLIKDKINLSNC